MPDLPTRQEFVTQTTGKRIFGIKKGRGPQLSLIDWSLDEYNLNKANANEKQMIALLYGVLKACKRWEKYKRRKGKTIGSRKTTGLSFRRHTAIKNVAYLALEKVNELMPGAKRAYRFHEKRKGLDFKLQSRGLHGAYAYERAFYLKTGKQYAAAASGFETVGTSVKNFPMGNPYLSQMYNRIKDKEFEQLTEDDFLLIGPYRSESVTYLNKIQRMRHAAFINDDGLFEDANGKLISMTSRNTWTNELDPQMYAMDEYGIIYLITYGSGLPNVSNIHASYTTDWFNHSSFLAGKEVVCAGCLVILNGRLLHLDNNSGHYRPPTEQLYICAEFLEAEGVDMDKCRIMDASRGKALFKASTFLQSKGTAQPDWTPEDDKRTGIM